MIEFDVQGLKCESCTRKIEQVLKKAGYSDAIVTLSPPKLKIASDEISTDTIQKIISTVGDYKITVAGKVGSLSVAETQASSSDEKLTPQSRT